MTEKIDDVINEITNQLFDEDQELIDVNKLEFKTIPKLKMIKFGENFDKLNDSEKILYLKKLSSSLNIALEAMQNERNELLLVLDEINKKLNAANDNAALQKSILVNAITNNNEEKQNDANRIKELIETITAKNKVIDILNEKLKKLNT